MKKTISLKIRSAPDLSYEIVIGTGLNIASEVKQLHLPGDYVVIMDSRVAKLYGSRVVSQFQNQKMRIQSIVFPEGERNKNLKNFFRISRKLFELGSTRKTAVIALGGGVTGDMAGYVAGTYMRGIPYIQVPTTLLAQVDSSVGGKVAVDLPKGKNSSGLFYQPKKVIIDTNFLETLKPDQYRSGLFEVIKHGIILNRTYFDYILRMEDKINSRDPAVLSRLVEGSCLIKAGIVQKDEKEAGLRMVLNYGHTVGHALEAVHHYRIPHGLAIGQGMLVEASISNQLGLLSEKEMGLIHSGLESIGLTSYSYRKPALIKAMTRDKKNSHENKTSELLIPMALPVKTGKVVIKKLNVKQINELLLDVERRKCLSV